MRNKVLNFPLSNNHGSSLCDRAGVPHHVSPRTRREFLSLAGGGFGAVALQGMLAAQARAESTTSPGSQQILPGPHHAPRAKSVIFLFMEGGPSQMDTFDRKPLLNRLAGQPLPASFDEPITAMGEKNTALLGCKRQWERHGESGLEISDWFPEVAKHADKLAVIRSCHGEGINHAGGCNLMNTSSILGGRPSLGAWATYGLGTGNADLPAFVVMQDRATPVVNGVRNWGNGFLPANFQGTPVGSDDPNQPIQNLSTPEGISVVRQREKLRLIEAMNRRHASRLPDVTELDARIASYELAYRMQSAAPEAVDLSDESAETKRLYGLEQKETTPYGRICLLARRLVERGVRFVQLYSGAGSGWDAHKGIEGNHTKFCGQVDRPIAALLTDLERRGLLDETLVVWGGEFGRTPMSEKGDGRDHNPTGFTMWMAGGGTKGGQTIGATDELGLHAIEDRFHVHDIHASILHLMGLDNMKLSYNYQGRLERPTVNEGDFIRSLVG